MGRGIKKKSSTQHRTKATHLMGRDGRLQTDCRYGCSRRSRRNSMSDDSLEKRKPVIRATSHRNEPSPVFRVFVTGSHFSQRPRHWKFSLLQTRRAACRPTKPSHHLGPRNPIPSLSTRPCNPKQSPPLTYQTHLNSHQLTADTTQPPIAPVMVVTAHYGSN